MHTAGGRGATVKRPACQSSDPGSILGSAGKKQTTLVDGVTDDFVWSLVWPICRGNFYLRSSISGVSSFLRNNNNTSDVRLHLPTLYCWALTPSWLCWPMLSRSHSLPPACVTVHGWTASKGASARRTHSSLNSFQARLKWFSRPEEQLHFFTRDGF